ncbi:MAG: SPASM domain-containing protein [bacterium]|nr:SPASM domain-containing protein [bacterium]
MKVVAYLFVGFVNGLGNPCQNFIWEDLEGKPVLLHIIDRLKMSKKITDFILYSHLAKKEEEDRKGLELARRYGLKLYLLKTDRWENMLEFQNSIGIKENDIVILPIVSPLIDIEIVDSLVERFKSLGADYMWMKDFPQGIGVKLWKANVWHKFCEIDPVGEFLKFGGHSSFAESSALFKKDCMIAEGIWSKPRLDFSMNTSCQLHLIRKIYKKYYKPFEIIDAKEVLSLYREEPEWFEFLPGSQLEIEVTNDCNLKCIMCPRTSEMSREINYMDFELFKKIVDETEALSIHFSGLGESLLHPQIREMFAYTKEKGLEVGLWTNGLNLDKDLARNIIKNELIDYVIFSLDAATQETYAKIKGVDVFNKAVKNIIEFSELKKELLRDKLNYYMARKPIIGVQIIKMKENDTEIEEFMNQWDFQEKAKKMVNYRNRVQQKDLMINIELWQIFYDKFLPIEHAIIGHFNNFCGQIENKNVIDVIPIKRFPCKQLQNGVSILWNGDIILCRQDFDGKYPLGNLRDHSLNEILESKKLKSIWQIHKNGNYDKLPLCKNCEEWYYNLYA